MAYTPKQAWSNAGRLVAICLGFTGREKRKLTKLEHKFNDDSGHHEITLKLEIRHDHLVSGVNTVMVESDGEVELDLIKELSSSLKLYRMEE